MGFNFHVGLPGPFSYTKRIGGNTHRARPVTDEQRMRNAELVNAHPGLNLFVTWVIALVLVICLSATGWGIVLAVGVLALAVTRTVSIVKKDKTDA